MTTIIDKDFLANIARDLPIIRPIKEFIHLNLLLPYQHLPFWDALLQVSVKLDANPFPSMDFYRERMKDNNQYQTAVRKKVSALDEEFNQEIILDHIFQKEFVFSHHDSRIGALHDQWNTFLEINIMQLADGMLIKWLSMFFDQGIGHWEMPGADEKSFYHCIKDLLKDSYIKPSPFGKLDIDALFPDEPEAAIEEHLNFLCPQNSFRSTYAEESILTLRGWAGMIFCIQQNPHLLPFPRKITLIDFLAVKLILERAWIVSENTFAKVPSFNLSVNPVSHPLQDKARFMAFRICQEAYEEITFEKMLNSIFNNQKVNDRKILYQAVFCMDDRECSLRRHIEEGSTQVETFGTAGHFGIECLYHHYEDAFPKKQCPAPIPARYLLRDVKNELKESSSEEKLSHHLIQPSGNLFKDWLFSHFDALLSTSKLVTNLFFPLLFKNLENIREIEPDTELKLVRYDSESHQQGLKEGYTLEEMTDLVYQQLELIGFVHHMAPLIFFIGHGSTSENNPYFATYGCGACSGRPGSANARALAQMSNIADVRKLIKLKYNLCIPDETYFVAGFHDTCKDIIELYDTEKIPASLKSNYKNFKKILSDALYKNAKERCQGFKRVSYRAVDKNAQKEVLRRSFSLFETRPELGHTNVAFAIVGRRDMTLGLNFSRRSFLQSYDSSIDPDGRILAQSLGAVIPVCSGISLDYFFSRVDNLRFGAGSKLPQNIVGQIGLSHGTESDLLFGLPFQMIDQHQPLRLFVLVEQKPEVALSAIQGNALVKQIVYNNWIHYGCYDEAQQKYYLFENGQMIEKVIGGVV